MSDNEIYLLIKYIKSVLWRVAKYQSHIQEARCLKVNTQFSAISIPSQTHTHTHTQQVLPLQGKKQYKIPGQGVVLGAEC